MKTILFILLAFISSIVSGQLPKSGFIVFPPLDSTDFIRSMIKTQDHGYLITTLNSHLNQSATTFIKTDSTGNVFAAARVVGSWRIMECSDGGFLAIGINSVMKTDKDLNERWAKKVTDSIPTFNFGEMAEINGSYYLSASAKNEQVVTGNGRISFYDTWGILLFKLDTSGNVKANASICDTTFWIDRFHYFFTGLTASADGSLYLAADLLRYMDGGTCIEFPSIVKLDTSLRVKWANQYTAGVYNFSEGLNALKDSTILLYGGYSNDYPYCSGFQNLVVKVDSSGNIVSSRRSHHKTAYIDEQTTQAIELNDTMLLISGSYYPDQISPAKQYIYITDYHGHILKSAGFNLPLHWGYQDVMPSEEYKGIIAASRMYNIDTLLFMQFDTSLTTTCFNSPNEMVDSDITVTMSSLTPDHLGHNFTFIDTTYSPFLSVTLTLENPCLVTYAAEMKGLDFSIYPNPSHDYFKIQVNSQDSKRIDLTVYNSVGSLVRRESFTKEITIMNRNSLAGGIYFYRLTEENGQAASGKFVVE